MKNPISTLLSAVAVTSVYAGWSLLLVAAPAQAGEQRENESNRTERVSNSSSEGQRSGRGDSENRGGGGDSENRGGGDNENRGGGDDHEGEKGGDKDHDKDGKPCDKGNKSVPEPSMMLGVSLLGGAFAAFKRRRNDAE